MRAIAIAGIVVCALSLGFEPAVADVRWELGIVSGANTARLTGDDVSGSALVNDGAQSLAAEGSIEDRRTGFIGGVVLTAMFAERSGIRTGVLYVSRGGEGQVAVTVNDGAGGFTVLGADVAIELDYVEIPVLAVLAVPLGDAASARFVAGPSVAFNTSAEIVVSAFDQSASDDFSDAVKAIDIGGIVGVGVAIPANRVNVLLDGRWSFGFTSIDDTGADDDVRNTGFAFTAGVGIPLSPTY